MWQSCFPSPHHGMWRRKQLTSEGLQRASWKKWYWAVPGGDGARSFPCRWLSLYLTSSHIQNNVFPISPPSPNFPNCLFGPNCPFGPLLAHIRLKIFMEWMYKWLFNAPYLVGYLSFWAFYLSLEYIPSSSFPLSQLPSPAGHNFSLHSSPANVLKSSPSSLLSLESMPHSVLLSFLKPLHAQLSHDRFLALNYRWDMVNT